MLREKREEFWKAGLAAINRIAKALLQASLGIITVMVAGCGGESQGVSDIVVAKMDGEAGEIGVSEGHDYDEAESICSEACSYDYSVDVRSIAAIYCDIYDKAIETNTLSLETIRSIVARLGEEGYVAVDEDNQIDMAGAERVAAFCKAVDAEEKAELAITVVTYLGFRIFDLKTEGGNVNIVRGYYQYVNGNLKNISTAAFIADAWQYTEEGYLLFEGSAFSESYYVLLLSDVPEQAALRVRPLDETCRELNRKYVLPVGYEKNNLFLSDWREEDFGELNLYDLFDRFYPMLYGQPVPYTMDDNLGVGAIYRIPEELFENVIRTYIDMDGEDIRSRTTYFSEDRSYEYKPRGFYELEATLPYPEVVDHTENRDGTITLIVNAVYPNENTSKAFSHELVVRPLADGSFRYVSNRIISPEEGYEMWWHSDRLTEEEWEGVYGGNE